MQIVYIDDDDIYESINDDDDGLYLVRFIKLT